MAKQLTQAQRDQKNERLRAARALAKQAQAAIVTTTRKPPKPTPAVSVPVPATRAVKAAPLVPKRKPGSGGARPGSGPDKKPVGEKMRIASFRATPEQIAKFAKLGGGAWVRARIEAATVKG